MRGLAYLGSLALLSASCAPIVPVYHEGLDAERYTRVNLRPEATTIVSSCLTVLPAKIPAGSAAWVTMYSDRQVSIKVHGVDYTMIPYTGVFQTDPKSIEAFLEKYFVDEKDDLDVAGMGPSDLADDVMSGQHVIGMTKEQVYTALGPPAFVDQTTPTVNLPYDKIMASDRWTYGHQRIVFVPTSMELLFGDGKLQQQIGP